MAERVSQKVQRVPENRPGYREANTAFLRAEIRETRDRMSDTLDALGDRLNPHRLKAQVKDNLREATVGRVENMARNAADRVNDTRHGIMDRIRENPIPAAMVGIGLGWLMFGGRHRNNHALWEGEGYVGDLSATTPRLIQDDAGGGVGSTISEEPGVVDKVRERVSGIGESVSDVGYAARERITDVREHVSDAGYRVGHVASRAGERAIEVAHHARDRFDTTLNENPVAIGAVALAVGMAAGLAIPESQREREMIGPYRDRLVGRVRESVDDTRERVQHVAERVVEETKDTIREAANDEGFTA